VFEGLARRALLTSRLSSLAVGDRLQNISQSRYNFFCGNKTSKMKYFFKNKQLFFFLLLVGLVFASGVLGQEDGEGSGEAAAEEAPAEEAPAVEG
jgi:hypothetical protein